MQQHEGPAIPCSVPSFQAQSRRGQSPDCQVPASTTANNRRTVPVPSSVPSLEGHRVPSPCETVLEDRRRAVVVPCSPEEEPRRYQQRDDDAAIVSEFSRRSSMEFSRRVQLLRHMQLVQRNLMQWVDCIEREVGLAANTSSSRSHSQYRALSGRTERQENSTSWDDIALAAYNDKCKKEALARELVSLSLPQQSTPPRIHSNGWQGPTSESTKNRLPSMLLSVTLSMAASEDRQKLSKYQYLVRESLEFFTATFEDTSISTQGRKVKIQCGQVGVRCRHCAHVPFLCRAKGAVNYPRSLSSIYQAAQNIALAHFLAGPVESCFSLPKALRCEMEKEKRDQRSSSVGKPYWAKTCVKQGLVERDGAVWMSPGRN